MKRQSVTIKDIAKELGISPSTVSRALKDHFEISEETKKEVRRVAQELNYQPNSVALSLRNSKSNTIGVIVPEIVHFFFSTVISGIEEVAHSLGYNVIITQSNESYDREVMNVQTLFNNRVDGILLSISMETFDMSHIEALIQKGLPIVLFDRSGGAKSCSSVTVDDFHGGYEATSHLISKGYKRIAHLAGPTGLVIMNERLAGYKKALEDHNIEVDEELIVHGKSGDDEEAFEATYDLLKKSHPDALFAPNDLAAMGAIQAALKYGKNVPQDFGVVGFSNWQFTKWTKPSITTIEQPGYEIGKESAKMLLEEIEAEEGEFIPQFKKLETKLLFRESSDKK